MVSPCVIQRAGGGFYMKKYVNKYNILVVRVTFDNKMENARPCYNCLDMMRACGIKKIYYSTKNGIICEKINNMVSINCSSATRHVDRLHYNAPLDDIEYYKTILLKRFPKIIKKKSLNNFLKYNIKNVLPFFKWEIVNEKIIIYDNDNNILIISTII